MLKIVLIPTDFWFSHILSSSLFLPHLLSFIFHISFHSEMFIRLFILVQGFHIVVLYFCFLYICYFSLVSEFEYRICIFNSEWTWSRLKVLLEIKYKFLLNLLQWKEQKGPWLQSSWLEIFSIFFLSLSFFFACFNDDKCCRFHL